MSLDTALNLQQFYPEEMDIIEVNHMNTEITIRISIRSRNCKCPKCGEVSEHRHGTYNRKVQDLPILGKTTFLLIHSYEYQGDNPSCETKTFAASSEGFLNYYSRMTERCEDFICMLALETSCEAAARICRAMKLKTSGDSIIRLFNKTICPTTGA